MSKRGKIIKNGKFYDRLEVEYVDKLEPKKEKLVEVKTMVFKPSKMKKKEEFRKLTEEYIDR